MDRDIAGIIAAPLVDWVKAAGYLLKGPSYRLYPDGSLRWEGASDFSNTVFRCLNHDVPEGIAQCGFRTVAALGGGPFAGTAWSLTYPGSYAWFLKKFDECVLNLGPQDGRLVSENERDLTHLRVLVKMYRKITAVVAEEFGQAVRRWFVDIGTRGVFGEAGITSISPTFRYLDRDVALELNAVGSGQETLNTLYLAILNWGMSGHHPLDSIDLAPDQYEKVFASTTSTKFV